MTMLALDSMAPDFNLAADDGTRFELSKHRGRPLVLFFYPKADTPGCTLEAQNFTALRPQFEALNVQIVGISADLPDLQCKFRDKHNLAIPLLSDPDHEVLVPYGVWGEKKNYGKTYMGIIRTTYLLNADGTVAAYWKVARTKGHAQKVLDTANTLFKKQP